MIGDRLEAYSFDYLMDFAMSYVPDTVDKRQGSIIYDAIAPLCYAMANTFMEMRNVYIDTMVQTATGEELDLRVAERGLTRYPATYALKRADFFNKQEMPMEVPIGSRYSTISDTNPINYVVIGQYMSEEGLPVSGAYILQCEQSGLIGNEYTGTMTNITFVQGLANVEMSTLIEPARDKEDDESLRARYFETVKNKPFGGNIAQYRKELGEIEGVGQVQVYPAWNGGGTVKCSIVDHQANPVSPEFINAVQNQVDPENSVGERGDGLGIAPIGHIVTIATPEEVPINISCSVSLMIDYTMDAVKPLIVKAIEDYINSIRALWSQSDDFNRYNVNVYIARISSSIMSVLGVANVFDITVNESNKDLNLTQTGELQQIPTLGEVILNG